MKKENWIEDVLGSSTKMKRAKANMYTATRVHSLLANQENFSRKWTYALAFCCLALFTINFIQMNNDQEQTTTQIATNTSSEYESDYTILYLY